MTPELRDELVEKLKEENDALRAQIMNLEEMLTPSGILTPIEWALTASEEKVFRALIVRDVASKEFILSHAYNGRPEVEIKIVDVFICKMRKKLKPYGVKIETRWGQGYFLPPEIRTRFRSKHIVERAVA